MKVLARLRDKKRGIIEILNYDPSLKNRVMKLFRGGVIPTASMNMT